MVPAVAVNVAVVFPAPTATVAGTLNAPTLLDSVTVAPPVFDTVTVHVELPPEPRLPGVHVRPLRTGGLGAAVTTPPAPVIVIASAAALAPSALITLIAALPVPAAIETLTAATTPFCMTLAFKPDSTQR